jgi:two-component system sensor histidine kinase YesM
MKYISAKNNSVYFKLLTTFLIVVMPLYILSMIINRVSERDVHKKITNSLQQQVNYYANMLDNEFRRIITVQMEYINDNDILDLSIKSEYMSDYGKTRAVINIQERIQLLKNLSNYVREVTVYIPGYNRKISTEKMITELSENPEEHFLYSQNSLLSKSALILWKNRLFLNIPFPDNQFSVKPDIPLFSINVEISADEIRNQLSNFVGYEDGGALFIGKSNDYYIYHGSGKDIADWIVNEFREKEDGIPDNGIHFIKNNKERYVLVYKQSEYLDGIYLAFFPESRILGELNSYKTRLYITIAAGAIFMLFFSYYMYNLISIPLGNIIYAFTRVENGDLASYIKHNRKDEFGHLYDRFNNMVNKLGNLIDQVYIEKIRVQEAELKQLQYQINPHFLYNSLYLIYRMAKIGDCDNIIKLSNHLRKYYEYIIHGNEPQITLEQEIEHVNNYIEVQNLRFKGRIRAYVQQLPEELKCYVVPRLILQPIVENAYKHGFKDKITDGRLYIKFETDENHLMVIIEDNGDIDDSQIYNLSSKLNQLENIEEHSGLFNVHKRIRIKYGPESGLYVSRSECGGLKVVLRMKLNN